MKAATREWIEKAEVDFTSTGREYRVRSRPNFDRFPPPLKKEG
jgi:hypothetical protein